MHGWGKYISLFALNEWHLANWNIGQLFVMFRCVLVRLDNDAFAASQHFLHDLILMSAWPGVASLFSGTCISTGSGHIQRLVCACMLSEPSSYTCRY